ncbi:MAG: hypothetical protein NTY36_05325 [Deltaproteobacteria bacterium]|nr:hypothetical protein [Deltaproteobacteria bacterium]
MLPQTFIDQVDSNCQLASAGQAGQFSLCSTLLRLRQLYKWEHQLPPWQEPESAQVLEWIEIKERTWEALEGAAWQQLVWNGQTFEPLAVAELNQRLVPQGFAYGAGLSRGQTPTCFLGELQEIRPHDDLTILVLGRELARDLGAAPALRQGPLIYARQETLSYYLWDRLSDPTQQKNAFLRIALAAYRLDLAGLLRHPTAHRDAYAGFLAGELEAVIHHEVGEALETSLGPTFATLLDLFPQSRVELWLRALKDALAEVNEFGRLSYLIAGRRLASLALMLALRPPLYHLLMPELEPAFCRLQTDGDWGELEMARILILTRLRGVAQELQKLMDSPDNLATEGLRAEIQQRYLAPLGL